LNGEDEEELGGGKAFYAQSSQVNFFDEGCPLTETRHIAVIWCFAVSKLVGFWVLGSPILCDRNANDNYGLMGTDGARELGRPKSHPMSQLSEG
jgi:hypothetical protein